MKAFIDITKTVILATAWIAVCTCAARYHVSASETERADALRHEKTSEFKRACEMVGGSPFTTTTPWLCISNRTGEPIQLLPKGVKP